MSIMEPKRGCHGGNYETGPMAGHKGCHETFFHFNHDFIAFIHLINTIGIKITNSSSDFFDRREKECLSRKGQAFGIFFVKKTHLEKNHLRKVSFIMARNQAVIYPYHQYLCYVTM